MAADAVQTPGSRWREVARVLAYTLAIALGFVALGRIELQWLGAASTRQWLERGGLLGEHGDAQLRREAAAIATASLDALARLPAGHKLAALRAGYEVGYTSYLLGTTTGSREAIRLATRAAADSHLALARSLIAPFGVTEVAELPVGNLKQFTELNARLEADESGIAARVQQRMSPLHRQLCQLGEQLGIEAARIDGSGGRLSLPPATLIRRHAMLAGIAQPLWEPLAREPQPDEPPAQVHARYHAALNALAAGLD